MLVMPIVNKDRILNVEINLKRIEKVKKRVCYDDVDANDIIVNYNSFNQSNYNTKNQEACNITEFIRYNSLMAKNDYFISTKEETNSQFYDIYQVSPPPLKITKGLDNFYGSLVLDLKNEIPNNIKGRYLDLKKIGMADHITDSKLEKLAIIADNIDEDFHKTLIDNHLEDLIETLNFLNLVDCRIIAKTSVKIEDFERVLNCLNATNSREAKDINNYYLIAKNNQETYSKLSRLYNIVYKDTLNWIHNDNKIKVKTDKSKYYGVANG